MTTMGRCVVLLWLLITVWTSPVSSRRHRHSNPEKRLFQRVIRAADAGSRPVINANTTVFVNFSLALNRIMDLAEKKRMMITHVWVFEKWNDERIFWDPKDFGGIEHVIVPCRSIWRPDIYILNTADNGDEGYVSVNDSRVAVHHNGTIEWIIPLIIKSSCAVDVKYFPFDNQICFVRFGSWFYEKGLLDITLNGKNLDMSSFETNSEFHLLSARLEREVITYDTFEGHYPQVTMYLHIKRKPMYYSYTVIAPTLVLCILNIFSFILPCDNGKKVGIGLTVFLSLYVLQLAIAENIPESDSLPLIGVFLTMVMTLNAVSLVFATLVINIKKKGDRKPCPPVPKLLLSLCTCVLGRLTCTYTGSYQEFYIECHEDLKNHVDRGTEEELTVAEDPDGECSTWTNNSVPRYRRSSHKSQPPGHDSHLRSLSPETRNLCRWRSRKTAPFDPDGREVKVTEPEKQRDHRLDWYYVAEVLDKTLFLIFLFATAATVSTTLIILPWLNDIE